MSDMTEPRSEWARTPMTEAIAFISTTVGEPFTAAQGNGLYWSALAVKRPNGIGPYPIALENLGSAVKVIVRFFDANDGCQTTAMKLYAIIGWATRHGHECEHD